MMKNNLKLVTLILALAGSVNGYTQENKNIMEELGFMAGNWKGTGWIMGKDRLRHTFSQTEIIRVKADNQALMIDGLGHATDSTGAVTDRVIHKAFGIISYNPDREMITMISFSEYKGRMESEIVFLEEDKKLQWSFKEENGGMIRFTEDFSTEGQWNEIGEISMNGTDWYQFFEMNLSRE
jgi:hypothetical protein